MSVNGDYEGIPSADRPLDKKAKNKQIRRERVKFAYSRFKRSWKTFYSSGYGKVGFYLLMFFVIITIISPLIVMQKDPVFYIVPSEDFCVASLEKSVNLSVNSPLMNPQTTSSSSVGTYLIHLNTNNRVLGVSTDTGAVYDLLNGSGFKQLSVYTIGNYNKYFNQGILSTSTYLLESTNNSIYFGQEKWSGSIYGEGNPSVKWSNMTVRNIVGTPISSAFDYHASISGIPEFLDTSYRPAYILVTNETNGSYVLHEYYACNLHSVFSAKLPYDIAPSGIYFYGSLFSTANLHDQLVLVVQGSNLIGFTRTGVLSLNVSFNSTISDVWIPSAFQGSNSSYNMIFVSHGDYVTGVSPFNGTTIPVYNGNSNILGIASTPGSSGFPSSFVVLTKGTLTLLTGPLSISKSVTISNIYTGIVGQESDFLVYSRDGDFVMAEYLTSSNPFAWSVSVSKPTSVPTIFLNSYTATSSFVVVSGNSVLIYGTTGTSINPLPPTLHTPSGQIFLLGTTSKGKDVWAQFIASFPSDFEIGLLVGIGLLLLTLLVSMFIGYFTGFASAAVETASLAVYLIPGLPLLIVVAELVKPNIFLLSLVLILLGWPFATFTLIGIIRSLKTRAFVDAAKVSGGSTMYILRKHMLPNLTPIIVYLTALNIGGAVAAVSTLQILGIAPLSVSTWGGMLSGFFDDYFALVLAPWWLIPPIIALTLFIFTFIFISRGLDEVVNPRLSVRR